jgi:serine/threonine protein kinase
LITDYCPGGELFLLLERQPAKVLKEDAVRYIIVQPIQIYYPSSTISINYLCFSTLMLLTLSNACDNNRFYTSEVVVALEYLHCQGKALISQ